MIPIKCKSIYGSFWVQSTSDYIVEIGEKILHDAFYYPPIPIVYKGLKNILIKLFLLCTLYFFKMEIYSKAE